MNACGREVCQGTKCGNFVKPDPEKGILGGCKGIDWSVPPWGWAKWYLEKFGDKAEEVTK